MKLRALTWYEFYSTGEIKYLLVKTQRGGTLVILISGERAKTAKLVAILMNSSHHKMN